MKKFAGLLAVAALAASSLVSGAPSGTFRQAHEVGFGSASDVDPISRGRVFTVTEKIMSRLVRPGPDGKPAPDLALSWSSNANATEWTFKLREGVKFHSGKPFTSADAAYSLKRVQDPKLDSPARSSISMVKSIETPDAKTLKLILAQSVFRKKVKLDFILGLLLKQLILICCASSSQPKWATNSVTIASNVLPCRGSLEGNIGYYFFLAPLLIGLPYFFIILSLCFTIKFTLLFFADFS